MTRPQPPSRWTERAPEGDSAEARAAALLRKLPPPAEPSPETVARMEGQIARALGGELSEHNFQGRASLRSTQRKLTVGALLVGGLAFASAGGWLLKRALFTEEIPSSEHTRLGPEQAPGESPREPRVQLMPELSLDETAPGSVSPSAEEPVRSKASHKRHRPSEKRHASRLRSGGVSEPGSKPQESSRALLGTGAANRAGSPATDDESAPTGSALPAPPAGGGSLGEESRLLGQAYTQLRRQQNPLAALETLEHYATRFPGGVLAGEASAARVDAHLALGQEREALSLLERLGPEGRRALPRSAEMSLLHAELLVGRGQARAALGALEQMESQLQTPTHQSRLLWARARAYWSLGQQEQARATAREYLRRFPGGDRVDEASLLLESE